MNDEMNLLIFFAPHVALFIGLIVLHYKTRRPIIRFRRQGEKHWEIAFSQEHLRGKLAGEMAEIIMPAKPLPLQVWRFFFPLKGIEGKVGKENITELK